MEGLLKSDWRPHWRLPHVQDLDVNVVVVSSLDGGEMEWEVVA